MVRACELSKLGGSKVEKNKACLRVCMLFLSFFFFCVCIGGWMVCCKTEAKGEGVVSFLPASKSEAWVLGDGGERVFGVLVGSYGLVDECGMYTWIPILIFIVMLLNPRRFWW